MTEEEIAKALFAPMVVVLFTVAFFAFYVLCVESFFEVSDEE